MEVKPENENSPTPVDTSRRTLLKISIGVMGGSLVAVPLIPALSYLIHPLRHSVTTTNGAEFIPLGPRSRFVGQLPVKIQLFADRRDAWNRLRHVQVGSCWLVDQQNSLTAFSSVCPHLGCAVDFDHESRKFKCPCHRSTFHELTGASESGPSPRGLDALELRQENDQLAIRYQRFRQGIPTKEPI